MLKNYFNVALRNLFKHKFYSLINILGLSVGLTCFLMISLYVVDELSYDTFHSDADRIYRMDFTGNINGSEFITALASAPAGPTMPAEFPEVEESTRLRGTGNWIIKAKNTEDAYNEDAVIYADRNFFTFWDFNLKSGNPETCLERPNTLVLSESLAAKVFGDEDPVGKIVVLDNNDDWEVTGVYEDMPSNSHFSFEMLLSMESREEAKSKMWMSFNFNTYLKLQEGYDPKDLEAKFPGLIEKYIGPEIQNFMGASLEEFYESGNDAGFYLFPLLDIHLKSDKLGELTVNGDMKYVLIFTAIAMFILILACINFMNLSTARSAGRAKEVGVRKVMGAYKSQLRKQFLAEAFLITFISILIAYGLSFLLLGQFNELADKAMNFNGLLSPAFLIIMLGVLIVVGFLAGSYPAFFLSKFRPVEVLKGKLNLGLKGGGLRSTLVVLQFCVSIIMIIGTAIVYQQLSYIQNKKLGYSKDHILMVHDPWLMDDKSDSYKNEALQHSNILAGTMSSFLPVNTADNNNAWFPGSNATKSETYIFHEYRVDHDYMETLGIEIKAGRSFSKDFPSDSSAVVLNEAAMHKLGWTEEEAIGKTISTFDGFQDSVYTASYKVIGVVKDFHFTSLRDQIEPLIFELGRSRGFVSFKITSENIPATINFLEDKWNEFAPSQPFAYSFLDERFNEMYENEQKLGKIFGVFAFLAIFIACLGLYGLAAFTAEQRTKEIGVRKVLGASIMSIITLLSKEFLKLVGIAFIIAAPVSYYFMNEWLQDFENRTNINVMIFILAGVVALVIAWVTMSFQSWNAARVNPARSLKDE
ncbi:ABC transporter permease [Ekhidna sp.]|jgi:putative ABC transport system permease protein|uniref:ABC transporter permease n=1 Tax=Ekhidna sp. TaxID=2608089 RepID=UPI0032EB4F4A